MPQPTKRQVEYLTDLFIDCGFTLKDRKAFLQSRFNREIAFLDELTGVEASKAITELRDQKERGLKSRWKREEEDE